MTASSLNLYSVGAVRSWNLNLPVETGTLSNLLSIEPLVMVFFGQKIPLFYNLIPKHPLPVFFGIKLSRIPGSQTTRRRDFRDNAGIP